MIHPLECWKQLILEYYLDTSKVIPDLSSTEISRHSLDASGRPSLLETAQKYPHTPSVWINRLVKVWGSQAASRWAKSGPVTNDTAASDLRSGQPQVKRLKFGRNQTDDCERERGLTRAPRDQGHVTVSRAIKQDHRYLRLSDPEALSARL